MKPYKTNRHQVWFSEDEVERYNDLNLKTPLRQKVKALFQEYCEIKELKHLTKLPDKEER